MNNQIWICIAFLLLTATAFGQQKDTLKQVVDNGSPEVKKFHERLSNAKTSNEHTLMILSLGKTGNKDFIPYLKALIKKSSCIRCIEEIPLVQLGETSYLQKAIADVDSQLKPICVSPYPVRKQDDYVKCTDTISLQQNAIWKLARFKTKEAYQKLYELLDNTANRNLEENTDYFIRTISNQTIYQLCQTVDNPPIDAKGNRCPSNIEIWKEWFEKSGLLNSDLSKQSCNLLWLELINNNE